MSLIPHTTAERFCADVVESDLPALAAFYDPRSVPCKALIPALHELADEYAGRVRFVKVNTEDEPGLVHYFQVTGVPVLMLFAGHRLIERMDGPPPGDALRDLLEEVTGGCGVA